MMRTSRREDRERQDGHVTLAAETLNLQHLTLLHFNPRNRSLDFQLLILLGLEQEQILTLSVVV